MALGFSINSYLMDGTPTGRLLVRLDNWSAIAYRIPRGQIVDSDKLDYIHTPGIYFLFGDNPSESVQRHFVYIGESEDVLKRVLQPHTFEADNIHCWNEVVMFVATDGNLDKAAVKFLENRFYLKAKTIGRYELMNGNTPTKPQLWQSIQDKLERFINKACLVMPSMGYRVFEEVKLQKNSSDAKTSIKDEISNIIFFIRKRDDAKFVASGTWNPWTSKFLLLKGSSVSSQQSETLRNYQIDFRRKYLATCVDSKFITTQDILFNSPSAAALFVCGSPRNGWIMWKSEDGNALEVYRPKLEKQ